MGHDSISSAKSYIGFFFIISYVKWLSGARSSKLPKHFGDKKGDKKILEIEFLEMNQMHLK